MKLYTVEQLKNIVFGVNENVNELLNLVDYCEAVVLGYHEFKKINEIGNKEDISEIMTGFENVRIDAYILYGDILEKVQEAKVVGGELEEIKSYPKAFVNKSIKDSIKFADSGEYVKGYINDAKQFINKQVEKLTSSAEKLNGVEDFCENYVSEGIVGNINSTLSLTTEGLRGIGACINSVNINEERNNV